MLRAPMARRRLAVVLALIAHTFVLEGCQRRIGSPCRTSVDCSIRGERICDLSHLVDGDGNQDPQGRGECTIDGCSPGSCPKEGICIQVYSTEFLSVACDPEREDRTREENRCDNNEICLPEGLCADISSVRRSCRKECTSDRNCRAGYECRGTGSNGVYVATDPADPTDIDTATICMPKRRVADEL